MITYNRSLKTYWKLLSRRRKMIIFYLYFVGLIVSSGLTAVAGIRISSDLTDATAMAKKAMAKKEFFLAICIVALALFSTVCLNMITKSYGHPVPFSELWSETTYKIDGQLKTFRGKYVVMVTGPYRSNLCVWIPEPLPPEATSLKKVWSKRRRRWEIQTFTEDANDVADTNDIEQRIIQAHSGRMGFFYSTAFKISLWTSTTDCSPLIF